jgi:hypothetical protein
VSKEQEADSNLRAFGRIQQESADNLRILGRRQAKADKIRIILAQALSECGEGKDFEEVRRAIGVAVSKIDQSSKKNFRKVGINVEMVELAKNKQKEWWDNIKAGLGIKPTLDIPDIKRDIKNDVE